MGCEVNNTNNTTAPEKKRLFVFGLHYCSVVYSILERDNKSLIFKTPLNLTFSVFLAVTAAHTSLTAQLTVRIVFVNYGIGFSNTLFFL